jgi:hypothetical protein
LAITKEKLMKERVNVKQHVKILAILYIALGALKVVAALVAFVVILAGGLLSGDQTALLATSIVAPVIALILLVLGIPGIVGGIGLVRGHSWAKYLVMFLAIFQLLDFPVGTTISLYTYWVLLHEESVGLFDSRPKPTTQMATG